MPGVVFLIVVPSANYEQTMVKDLRSPDHYNIAPLPSYGSSDYSNANQPHSSVKNETLRLEVELRNKHSLPNQVVCRGAKRIDAGRAKPPAYDDKNMLPMEKVLEQLLVKLSIKHVTWSLDKEGNYYHVVFPLQAGDPCETTLHCLTELKIGKLKGSNVSVLPCTVNYDALHANDEVDDMSPEDISKWNNFVESIKSKLTVKQVVDGVRSGGALSFDYLLLIVTADSLAALGLVENNAPNITAAMLVSPLMGPVMSITFGAIISDRDLIKCGFISLSLGMLISLVFGLVFGLILGSTEMPWGFGDWPTEEMKGRGNARSLWMGVMWALTSGTGVAVALLQGAVGPLIGVAISASLLPPVVNCGLYWSLACTWLLNNGTRIPHLKGESYTGNSSYVPIYTDYMPTEFFINGIVSAMLTVVNVICIFITAIMVLKIKEVAAPYTASADLRRFWETDIRTVRKTNRSTMRRKNTMEMRSTVFDKPMSERTSQMGSALEQALKQVSDDTTFRKVKRMSYSGHAVDELSTRFGVAPNSGNNSPLTSLRNSAITSDLNALENIISSLSQRQQQLYKSTLTNQLTKATKRPSFKDDRNNGRDSLDSSGNARSGDGAGRMATIPEQRNSFDRTRDICQRISALANSSPSARKSPDAEEVTNLTQNMLE